MDELTAQIEALFLRYGLGEPGLRNLDDAAVDQFRAEVRLLIAEYGQEAVGATLDAITPDR
jgi:hypothetical protein